MLSRHGDKLPAGWVVDTLDADHFGRHEGRVVLHVPRQLGLRRRGSNNQNGVDGVEFPRHLGEESTGVARMLPRFTTSFWMTMDVALRRQHRGFVARIRMNMEDTGFLVVDPDDSMGRHDGSSVGLSVAASEHP